jgi:hypothetical protein
VASFVWNRDFDEAYSNPYEYGEQKQFVREAKAVLHRIQKGLQRLDFKFTKGDESLEKAAWMLHNDAIDALLDALELLQRKKHRLVGRIFRDVWESAQIVEYFLSGTPKSKTHLKKWYKNKIINHRDVRDALERAGKRKQKEAARQQHMSFSQWTHRSYRALLKAYSLGDAEKMVYDGYGNDSVLPHTISAYYAILGMLILQNVRAIGQSQTIPKAEIQEIMKESMQKEAVKRRFAPNPKFPDTRDCQV